MRQRCPKCEFTYAWDGEFCGHCHAPFPRRVAWEACGDPRWFYRHHPATPFRRLLLFGCAAVRSVPRFLTVGMAGLLERLEGETFSGARPAARHGPACQAVRDLLGRTEAAGSAGRALAEAVVQLGAAVDGRQVEPVFAAANLAAEAEGLAAIPLTPDERVERPAFLAGLGERGGLQGTTAEEREQWAQWRAAQGRGASTHLLRQATTRSATARLCDLYRDVVRYPFEPLAFDPAWRTTTAVALARGMAETRDFSPMPILADALQDAGCEHPEILDHCRSDRAHVLGCWVIDGVLGWASVGA